MANQEPATTNVFAEFRRRKVWRVTGAYVVVGFGVLQGAELLISALTLPEWTLRLVILLTLLGFPVAVVLAWAFDVTPQGIRATGSRGQPRRHPVALGVAATLVAVTAGWFVWPRVGLPDSGIEGELQTNRVAIPAFVNQSMDPSLEALGAIASDWISNGLMGVPELSVVPGQVSRDAFSADTTGSPLAALAGRTRAAILVTGSYFVRGDSIEISAQILTGDELNLLYAVGPHAAPTSNPTAALAPLGDEVGGRLAQHLEWNNPEGSRLFSSPPSYEAFAEVRRGGTHFEVGRWRDALPYYMRAAELAPGWEAPYRLQAWCHVNLGDWEAVDSLAAVIRGIPNLTRIETLMVERLEHRVAGDSRRDHETLLEMASINPWEFLYQLGYTSIFLNRPGEAIVHYSRLPEILSAYTPWHFWWSQHANALHMLGRYEEAVAVAQDGLRHHPRSRLLHGMELRHLAASGRFEEAAERAGGLVDDDLETSNMGFVFRTVGSEIAAHEGDQVLAREMFERSVEVYEGMTSQPVWAFTESLSWLGRYEPTALDRAEVFLRGSSETDPTQPDYLGWLGATLARTGNRARAREYLTLLDERSRGESPARDYRIGAGNLAAARIYAALGETAPAIAQLTEAFARGIVFGPWIHVDPYLQLLVGVPDFDALVRPVG